MVKGFLRGWGCAWVFFVLGFSGVGFGIEHEGMLLSDSPELPQSLRKSLPAVFRLVVHVETAFFYPKLDKLKSQTYVTEQCRPSTADFMQKLNCDAVITCLDNFPKEKGGHCYAPYLTGGTAWISAEHQGRSVVATAWHPLRRQFAMQLVFSRAVAVKPAVQRREITQQFLPMFSLYDGQGNLVYTSAKEKISPRFVALGDFIGAAYTAPEKQTLAALFEDYAFIEVPKLLGSPLTIASEAVHPDDFAYAVGFPIKVERREKSHGVLSDGNQLYVSPGKIYSRETFEKLVTPIIEEKKEIIAQKSQAEDHLVKDYSLPEHDFVYASCDVVGGNSGGPLLNREGEVVGMLVASFSDENKYNPAGSLSLLASHLPPLKKGD